jgi:hypothetical protein
MSQCSPWSVKVRLLQTGQRDIDRPGRSEWHFHALAKGISMSDLLEMQQLRAEIAGHVKAGTRAEKRRAADKLNQLAALATTMGFTIRPQH